MVTDNDLFNRMPTKSELLSLQHHAEAVNQSLASIEAQEPEDSNDEFTVQTGYSKDRLVDTVKAHLMQVQRSLSSRMTLLIAQQEAPAQTSTELVNVSNAFQRYRSHRITQILYFYFLFC